MKHVLLLGRDPDLQQLLRDFLGASGYVVVEASTDRAAVEALTTDTVDVIVAEVSRLSVDLRATRRQLPLLALAEMDDPVGSELPATEHTRMLTKPASLHAIAAALGELLNH